MMNIYENGLDVLEHIKAKKRKTYGLRNIKKMRTIIKVNPKLGKREGD